MPCDSRFILKLSNWNFEIRTSAAPPYCSPNTCLRREIIYPDYTKEMTPKFCLSWYRSRSWKLISSTNSWTIKKTWTIRNKYNSRYRKTAYFKPYLFWIYGSHLTRLRDLTWYGKRGFYVSTFYQYYNQYHQRFYKNVGDVISPSVLLKPLVI